jgi:ABC-type nitrate/sulfonate/bicarbonate transport system ATPase subunit
MAPHSIEPESPPAGPGTDHLLLDEGEPGSAPVPAVRLEGVSKSYERVIGRSMVRTHAVQDVSFDVAEHQFVSIIGPSGCGKSTVMKMVAGLLDQTAGRVRVFGKDISGPGPERACVFQAAALMPWKTAVQNIEMALEFRGVPASQRTERALIGLQKVGLESFASHYTSQLYGGMAQRVALARALSTEPAILLMDEPFGALDALTLSQMQTELIDIWERARSSVIFITHSIEEAVLLSDRVLVMGANGTLDMDVAVPLTRPRTRKGMLADAQSVDLMTQLEQLLHTSTEEGPRP